MTGVTQMKATFNALFNHAPTGHVSAPGRVNLIGEFTDYNEGFVLPTAINFRTQVLYSARRDDKVCVYSTNYPNEVDEFSLSDEITVGDCQWGNYIRAVVYVLKRAGYKVGGLNLLIESDVPQGAGLSSSAALEVATIGAFNQAFSLAINEKDIALLGQQAENDFMDCQCGIMDQLISAKAEQGNALLIDCQQLATTAISIPENLSIVIVNSNYPRKLVDSEYNQRRLDCENAASKMQVDSLRKADMAMLEQHKGAFTEDEYKRAHHVISENERVVQATQALRNNDMSLLIELMAASHQSLHQDFEVTVPATHGLVTIISQALENRGAVRMTGGGFGGAVVCLCRANDVEVIKQAIDATYYKEFGLMADIYVCQADTGLTYHQLV